MVMLPPERAMAPEPDAKVMFPTFTEPLTVIVPAVRPVVPFPKLTASVVALVEAVV